MKNPCKICLIQACCTDICNEKFAFLDHSLQKLYELDKKHIYTEDGFKKSNVPQTIQEQHEKFVSVCMKNKDEIDNIMNRYIDLVVPR